jgi:hypothetical protein
MERDHTEGERDTINIIRNYETAGKHHDWLQSLPRRISFAAPHPLFPLVVYDMRPQPSAYHFMVV